MSQGALPTLPQPFSHQAAGEQVNDDRPMGGDARERDGRRAERQGRSDDHEAHRFVEDHRLQRRKTERADQQR